MHHLVSVTCYYGDGDQFRQERSVSVSDTRHESSGARPFSRGDADVFVGADRLPDGAAVGSCHTRSTAAAWRRTCHDRERVLVNRAVYMHFDLDRLLGWVRAWATLRTIRITRSIHRNRATSSCSTRRSTSRGALYQTHDRDGRRRGRYPRRQGLRQRCRGTEPYLGDVVTNCYSDLSSAPAMSSRRTQSTSWATTGQTASTRAASAPCPWTTSSAKPGSATGPPRPSAQLGRWSSADG